MKINGMKPHTIRFTDYRGEQIEEYLLGGDALFRFEQLASFPGVTNISWIAPAGHTIMIASRTE